MPSDPGVDAEILQHAFAALERLRPGEIELALSRDTPLGPTRDDEPGLDFDSLDLLELVLTLEEDDALVLCDDAPLADIATIGDLARCLRSA